MNLCSCPRRRLRALTALGAAVCSLVLTCGAGAQEIVQDPGLVDAVKKTYGLRDPVVVRLNVDKQYEVQQVIFVPLGARWEVLHLWPHSIRAENYRVFESPAPGVYNEV